MDSVIEKLGIKPIEHPGVKHMDVIRDLEQQRNELFKNTYDLCEEMCRLCVRLNPQHENCINCDDLEYWRKPLVAKSGKSWQKIRELIG